MWFAVVYQHVWLPVVCVHVLVVHVSEYCVLSLYVSFHILSPSFTFLHLFTRSHLLPLFGFSCLQEIIVSDIQTHTHTHTHIVTTTCFRYMHQDNHVCIAYHIASMVEMYLNPHVTLAYAVHDIWNIIASIILVNHYYYHTNFTLL